MGQKLHTTLAQERHRVRLVQLVAAGTPGAVVDPITGSSFVTRWLDGGQEREPGWSQVSWLPTLGDATEFTITIPPVGPDGKRASDRFYCLSETPDVTSPGELVSYFPGDEWLEVYRDPQELIAVGTPIDVTIQTDQVQLHCRDVLQPLKKTKETSGGFWCNSPRDVFEHYSRLWLPVIADDFPDSIAQFPAAGPATGTTPNGRWQYRLAKGLEPGLVLLSDDGAGAGVWSTATAAGSDHGCMRAEASFPYFAPVSPGDYIGLSIDDSASGTILAAVYVFGTDPLTVAAYTSAPIAWWPVVTPTDLAAPYTLSVETRDRWFLFYVQGQLIASAAVGGAAGHDYRARAFLTGNGAAAKVDYVVMRKTSEPLNGGASGDYTLPSVPAPGGLNAEYYDLTSIAAQQTTGVAMLTAFAPAPSYKVGERVEEFPPGTAVGWQMAPLQSTNPWAVRWTGAIYLPLDTQDVHLATPPSITNTMRVWVGKTKWGEWLFDGSNQVSAGLRSTLGSVPGWYPIMIELLFFPGDTGNPTMTWDVGGVGTPIPNTMLAPLGVLRSKVPAGDSHYDTLRQIANDFAYQFKSTPHRLESGQFPGSLTPEIRVGRDTAYTLTLEEAISPQVTVNYEDVTTTLLAAAAGLGGSSDGTLTLEAFDFSGLAKHAFVSQEAENLPTITVQAQLLSTLLSLLGYRTSGWEDLQAQVPGIREKIDSFPLTGDLAEFDWQPGDGLKVNAPDIAVDDQSPRQIFQLARTLLPDGNGDNKASFRPRNRDPLTTLRKFVRQVYGDRRTFQGQLVTAAPTNATSPGIAQVALPADLANVRRCDLVVVAKDNTTTPFDVIVNGVTLGWQITTTGRYNLGAVIGRNGTEPRMIAQLVNAPADGTHASYQLDVLTLIPAI